MTKKVETSLRYHSITLPFKLIQKRDFGSKSNRLFNSAANVQFQRQGPEKTTGGNTFDFIFLGNIGRHF